jgi:tRNA(Ile)-lysidine synthase
VLKLQWHVENPAKESNFETLARRFRYQALGRACAKYDINSLLLAHHSDDQLETFIMRLANGHSKSGLLGMRESAGIPECFGLHGVHRSGRHTPWRSRTDVDGATVPENRKHESSNTSTDSLNSDENIRWQNARLHSGADKHAPLLREAHESTNDQRKQQTIVRYYPLATDRQYPSQSTGKRVQESLYNFEDGGVNIYRPLLRFDKHSLIKTCQSWRTKWFEDHTNKDATLTLRNAIRHIYGKYEMPEALKKHSILRTMKAMQEQDSKIDASAKDLYNQCHIHNFNYRGGTLNVRFPLSGCQRDKDVPESRRNLSPAEIRERDRRALRMVIELLTPEDTVKTAKLDRFSDIVFEHSDIFQHREWLEMWKKGRPSFTIASLHFERIESTLSKKVEDIEPQANLNQNYEWIISRQPFMSHGQKDLTMVFPPTNGTDIHDFNDCRLWDGRYWISLENNTNDTIIVRPFNKEDLKPFRNSLDPKTRNYFGDTMKSKAPGDVRWTIPAIVSRGDVYNGQERVLALPTMNVAVADIKTHHEALHWGVRFKQTDMAIQLQKGKLLKHKKKVLRSSKPKQS